MSTEGFTLLWSKILDSSVWLQDKDTRLVWITMLAMRDSEGRVLAAPGALANRARVEKSACLKALKIFLSPDPESGNPANEGRRISEIRGGWQILNHEEYRFSTEAKREFWREQKRKQKEAKEALKSLQNHEGPMAGEASYVKAEANGDVRNLEIADGADIGAYGSGAEPQSNPPSSCIPLQGGVNGDLNGTVEAPVDDTPDPDAMP